MLTTDFDAATLREVAEAYERLEAQAESPAEHELNNALNFAYHVTDIQSQVRLGGYRVDALTPDGIAWEVDGRKYHDDKRDRVRDGWILEHIEGVVAIVRIPASVVWFYPHATAGVIKELAGFERPSWGCLTYPEHATDFADDAVENWGNYGAGPTWSMIQGECYEFDSGRDTAKVGTPLAFISVNHEVWEQIPASEYGKCRWTGQIEKRTLQNLRKWRGK